MRQTAEDPILALDFDGVLCDSARESFLVASAAQRQLTGHDACLRLPNATPGRLAAPHPDDEIFQSFIDMMPLGNRAEDYSVVLSAICGSRTLKNQAEYDRFKSGRSPDDLEAFHQLYYEMRAQFREHDPDGWLALLPPFPGVDDALARLATTHTLAIATARDLASVERILRHYGLRPLFADALVLDKETGLSKKAHLRELARRTESPFDSITFVDDKVNHLHDVAPLGVRCALAGWGYNGSREHQAALQAGFRVLDSLDELAE